MSGLFSLLCYVVTILLNCFWIQQGDRLALSLQLMIPPISVLLWGLGLWVHSRNLSDLQRKTKIRRSQWLLLGYYLWILWILLLAGGLFHVDRGIGGSVNLVPFHTIDRYVRFYQRTGSMVSVFNLLGNVIILMPFGVILPVMFRPMRHFLCYLPTVSAVALGAEWLQYRTNRGTADVDDAILNIFGAVIGYVITIIILWIHSMITKRKKR